MFSFHRCYELQDNIYDEKINKNILDQLITRYSLIKEGSFKEYWINNVEIIKTENEIISYNYINDLSITYDKEYSLLIREYECEKCQYFSLYNVDYETKYDSYKSILGNITVMVKCYDNYLTLEFICSRKEDLYGNVYLVK